MLAESEAHLSHPGTLVLKAICKPLRLPGASSWRVGPMASGGRGESIYVCFVTDACGCAPVVSFVFFFPWSALHNTAFFCDGQGCPCVRSWRDIIFASATTNDYS